MQICTLILLCHELVSDPCYCTPKSCTFVLYHVMFQCLAQICTASALFAMFFTPLDFLLITCTIGTEFITTVVPKRLGDVLGSKREGTLLMFRNIKSLFKAEMT